MKKFLSLGETLKRTDVKMLTTGGAKLGNNECDASYCCWGQFNDGPAGCNYISYRIFAGCHDLIFSTCNDFCAVAGHAAGASASCAASGPGTPGGYCGENPGCGL
ncbi:MAG: hypothetical protein QM528_09195 [Phycisphaerales bacterium]|nr:hypothetical protein [Phycisphaerales bacterium]